MARRAGGAALDRRRQGVGRNGRTTPKTANPGEAPGFDDCSDLVEIGGIEPPTS
jgi:hypothetical protein